MTGFGEVAEGNSRQEQLASREVLICQIMSFALPGISSFVSEDQPEKGRTAECCVCQRGSVLG